MNVSLFVSSVSILFHLANKETILKSQELFVTMSLQNLSSRGLYFEAG